ncbi:hypothetical protein LCGC14_0897260 [marine sediment metagenome]|uniref:Right handed beta helix domain-containing protein n=1 Tax=marine sediment metagenome TaxID=412755 RepID=A0A0F9NXF5_9ZZZZ|nr:hypothetical protein [Phycisphaerae bacterium]
MASRFWHKVKALTEITDLPNATGISTLNGQPYYHDGSNVVGLGISSPGKKYFVDGDNGATTNGGQGWGDAFSTIAGAISAADTGDSIFIRALAMATGATDPSNYAETLTIPADKDRLSLIGVPGTPAQGRQPQIKIGAGSTAMLTVRAPGCLIQGLSFNGGSSTGGGILLDDDGSTKTAFGTVIADCFFKNCKGSAAASTGGGIMIAATGGTWQCRFTGCHFFNNRAGITLKGTSQARPKDLVIEDCTFGADVNTTVDADIYLAAGSGVDGLIIRRCTFSVVDVPAYASSPDAARYVELTGCTDGVISGCDFSCQDSKTFGAAGDGAIIPTTIRMPRNYYEAAAASSDQGLVGRT